jgi:hypothetical protein
VGSPCHRYIARNNANKDENCIDICSVGGFLQITVEMVFPISGSVKPLFTSARSPDVMHTSELVFIIQSEEDTLQRNGVTRELECMQIRDTLNQVYKDPEEIQFVVKGTAAATAGEEALLLCKQAAAVWTIRVTPMALTMCQPSTSSSAKRSYCIHSWASHDNAH